jgi:hypothetical protein
VYATIVAEAASLPESAGIVSTKVATPLPVFVTMKSSESWPPGTVFCVAPGTIESDGALWTVVLTRFEVEPN